MGAPQNVPNGSDSTAQAPSAAKHPYEFASDQRTQVLDSFDAQRRAILKAVADQRAAVTAPIRDVHNRQPNRAQGPAVGTSISTMPLGDLQLTVAGEVVAQLKALVAEEVRAQLILLLEAATCRQVDSAQKRSA